MTSLYCSTPLHHKHPPTASSCHFLLLYPTHQGDLTKWKRSISCIHLKMGAHILLISTLSSTAVRQNSWLEFSWRRHWRPTPVLLPGKSLGRRSLVGCSPWGCWESDTTERLHFHLSHSCIGEENGNPLQYSCLENPRDGGAWWAAVYGVAQSRTRLTWLSSSRVQYIQSHWTLWHSFPTTFKVSHNHQSYFLTALCQSGLLILAIMLQVKDYYYLFSLLKYRWFMILCKFQVYSKVIPYILFSGCFPL